MTLWTLPRSLIINNHVLHFTFRISPIYWMMRIESTYEAFSSIILDDSFFSGGGGEGVVVADCNLNRSTVAMKIKARTFCWSPKIKVEPIANFRSSRFLFFFFWSGDAFGRISRKIHEIQTARWFFNIFFEFLSLFCLVCFISFYEGNLFLFSGKYILCPFKWDIVNCMHCCNYLARY